MRPYHVAAFALAVIANLTWTTPTVAQEVRINGAGASFPFPLYSAWFRHYNRITSGVRINYQSVGSGAGVRNLINRTVDFSASDAAMTDAEIAEVQDGVVILPMTAGQAALASADLSGDDLRIWVTDPSDPAAYPIATFTWMLFFRSHGNDRVAEALRDFVTWAMADGQGMAEELGYIPLPEILVKRVLAQVPDIQ